MSSSEFPVGAYFYPFTTTCEEFNARAAGIDFPVVDETELVKQALPLFPGHEQPQTYCLGDPSVTNWDNADTHAMGRQVDLMQETGLDFVVFDTYGGRREGRNAREYEAPIDTFLQGKREGLGFAIMWSLDAPRIMLPAPPQIDLKTEPGRAYDVSAETAHFIVDECAKKYWSDPGYLLIDDRPYLSLYNTVMPIDDETKGVYLDFVQEIKEYALRKYKIEPYIVGIGRGARKANIAMDGASAYALLPFFSRDGGDDIQRYDDLASGIHKRWEDIASGSSVPFVPPAVLGWDASPRGTPGQRLEDVAGKYPYTPIVIDATPEKAAAMLKSTLEWTSERVPPPERYGVICAWNEISERAALLPTVKEGEADFSYLNAIAAVLKNRPKQPEIVEGFTN